MTFDINFHRWADPSFAKNTLLGGIPFQLHKAGEPLLNCLSLIPSCIPVGDKVNVIGAGSSITHL